MLIIKNRKLNIFYIALVLISLFYISLGQISSGNNGLKPNQSINSRANQDHLKRIRGDFEQEPNIDFVMPQPEVYKPIAQPVFNAVPPIVTQPMYTAETFNVATDYLKSGWDKISSTSSEAMKKVSDGSSQAWGSVRDTTTGFYEDTIRPTYDIATEKVSNAYDKTKKGMNVAWNATTDSFSKISDPILGLKDKIGNFISDDEDSLVDAERKKAQKMKKELNDDEKELEKHSTSTFKPMQYMYYPTTGAVNYGYNNYGYNNYGYNNGYYRGYSQPYGSYGGYSYNTYRPWNNNYYHRNRRYRTEYSRHRGGWEYDSDS